ncbi:MAG: biotin--[acetyl-CoA-carboxylase] ligase [Oscillospiraceae bacterium]|jgi:BirA family biotin operon repressor/biotin-[acetyl-CoA-carboxylase] ligase|nr:biotin--[acetyl-CoA-carboxylase] ligase [Oscillospiraceae bacterium]
MSLKKSVLAFFESKRGQTVSGELIAGAFGVSRNAVWKAVRELERDGYIIKATSNKGYCFCDSNDILSVQGMLPFLLDKETASRIFVYPLLESTNKTAKEMAVSGAEHSTVIIADCQTAGRGRYGRSFFSPSSHGIYMSLILRPERLSFSTPTLVTAFAAVSVCMAIEAISDKSPQIKWVNDVFLDKRKVCGILTEAVTDYESGNAEWIVVGIGINFSTPLEDFPEELRHSAGAVFNADNIQATRNHLIAEIINRMLTNGFRYSEADMLDEYRKRLMMLGKRILVSDAQEPYEALAVDIDNNGCLIIKKDNGELKSISSGEIYVTVRRSGVRLHEEQYFSI